YAAAKQARYRERLRARKTLTPHEAAVTSLVRASIATSLAVFDKPTRPAEIARRQWGDDDRNVELVLRAATQPASLAGNSALAQIAASFLDTLTAVSAGADLLTRGIGLNFNGAAQINVPGLTVPTADFVAEGAPIPVVQAVSSGGPS